MEQIVTYINPELLVLVPVLYIAGMVLKRAGWWPDKLIPAGLCLAGMALALLYTLATAIYTGPQSVLLAIFTALVQGLLCAGGAVLANQITKQAKKGD